MAIDPNRRRQNVVRTAKQIAELLGNGRYFVRRGAINYASWEWKTYPWTCSILIPNSSLYQTPDTIEMPASIAIELATRVPSPEDTKKPTEGFDDEVLDQLFQDAETFFDALKNARDDQTDPVVFRMSNPQVQEMADPTFGVVGIDASAEITC